MRRGEPSGQRACQEGDQGGVCAGAAVSVEVSEEVTEQEGVRTVIVVTAAAVDSSTPIDAAPVSEKSSTETQSLA